MEIIHPAPIMYQVHYFSRVIKSNLPSQSLFIFCLIIQWYLPAYQKCLGSCLSFNAVELLLDALVQAFLPWVLRSLNWQRPVSRGQEANIL